MHVVIYHAMTTFDIQLCMEIHGTVVHVTKREICSLSFQKELNWILFNWIESKPVSKLVMLVFYRTTQCCVFSNFDRLWIHGPSFFWHYLGLYQSHHQCGTGLRSYHRYSLHIVETEWILHRLNYEMWSLNLISLHRRSQVNCVICVNICGDLSLPFFHCTWCHRV